VPVTHHLREGFLPSLSLRRPVTVVMAFVALLVVGYVAYTRVPVSMLPSGQENPFLYLYVPYPNSSPAEVEQRIARPLEGVLRTMSGIDRLNTNSDANGCGAFIQFDQNADMDEEYNQLRDRIDRLMAELPSDVRRVYVHRWNMENIPVLGIDFPVTGSFTDLYAVVNEQIRQPIERLDGVARVDVWGAEVYRVEIGLVQDRVNAHGVDVYRLIQQLERDNFAMSSGWVRDGGEKLYVRSDARFTSLAEIRNLPIEGHPGLVLSDLAEVVYAPPERHEFFRFDGHPGVTVMVQKESMANTIDVAQRVLAALEGDILRRPQLAGFTPHVFLNQATIILTSLNQLRSTGLWGGLFAIFVLYFFLRRVRMTLVISAAIPLSVLISMTLIYFMGWSLNIITMMGLIIGLGMVVDNSIVVTEAIYVRRLAGEGLFRAALHGASEVGLAITVSTLTTVAVFMPLIFMTGSREMAFIMARIGMPVSFALLGSLLVALLFIPLVMSRIMSGKPPVEPRSVVLLANAYQRGLGWVMNHRLEMALIALVLMASLAIPLDKVVSSEDGQGNIVANLSVSFDMPDHYSPQQADRILRRYEAFMEANRRRYGLDYVETRYWQGGGSIWAILKPDTRPWYTYAWHNLRRKAGLPADVPLSAQEALDHFRKNAPRFAGVELSVDRREDETQRTSVTLFGDDTRTLVRLAREVERRLRLLPEITEVKSDMDEGTDELRLRVDRMRAMEYGIDGGTIGSTVGYVMRGVELNPFHTPERDITIQAGLREEDRRTLDQVLNLVIAGPGGSRVRLGSLVDVEVGKDLKSISREDGKTRVIVTAISPTKDIRSLADRITSAMKDVQLPRGYQWSLSGQFERMEDEFSDVRFAMIMAVTFVFLLMGILFESFILPLSVIVSIPFGFLGVYWLFYVTGSQMGVMAMIGTIVLIGVVVNNAIVLVDLVNRLRADGLDRRTAIMEAGRNRLRPILMTSGTTVFGLVPMAISNANMVGIPYDTLGLAMIGGLVASTFMTLFMVPLFYSLFDDLRVFAARFVASASSARGSRAQDVAP